MQVYNTPTDSINIKLTINLLYKKLVYKHKLRSLLFFVPVNHNVGISNYDDQKPFQLNDNCKHSKAFKISLNLYITICHLMPVTFKENVIFNILMLSHLLTLNKSFHWIIEMSD